MKQYYKSSLVIKYSTERSTTQVVQQRIAFEIIYGPFKIANNIFKQNGIYLIF